MKRVSVSGLEVFLMIARRGSLRAAGKALGIGPPAVSHQLKAFERHLGVDLFARTTRSLELTEAGAALFKRAGPAFADIKDALEDARGIGDAERGVLRLTLPWSAYKIVIEPVLSRFRLAYPDIQLDMSFDEALVDVVHEGFHAGIRLGDQLAPGMVAFRLTRPLQAAYSASPSYLNAHGRPKHPDELTQHDCIRYKFVTTQRIADWQFRQDGERFTVEPGAALIFDNFQAVVNAACNGHGIGWSLRAVVETELRSGRLESVLDGFVLEHPPFFLYYPEQNRRLGLLRVFLDFLSKSKVRST